MTTAQNDNARSLGCGRCLFPSSVNRSLAVEPYSSRKERSGSERLGWRSLRSALASI